MVWLLKCWTYEGWFKGNTARNHYIPVWFPWPGVYEYERERERSYEFYYSSKIDSGPKAQASTHLQFQKGREDRKRVWGGEWIGFHEEKGEKDRGVQKNGGDERKMKTSWFNLQAPYRCLHQVSCLKREVGERMLMKRKRKKCSKQRIGQE